MLLFSLEEVAFGLMELGRNKHLVLIILTFKYEQVSQIAKVSAFE